MKKLFAILLALSMVLSLAACVSTKPAETNPDMPGETAAALQKFTVTVVHADGSEKTFAYETGDTRLGDYLENEGLISSEGAEPGMFHTVDGEKADWNENQSYWAFYLGQEYAMTGIYDATITDGAVYRLVYTKG